LNYTSAIFPLVCRLENWFPTYLERWGYSRIGRWWIFGRKKAEVRGSG